jgi:PKHD-type hydroxylase
MSIDDRTTGTRKSLPASAPANELPPLAAEAAYAARVSVFTPEEAARLRAIAAARPSAVAEVSRAGEIDATYRSARLAWLQPSQEPWLFERLARHVEEINRASFGFELAGFHDPLQLTQYAAGDAGHYDWHVDRGTVATGRPPRKLTVVVQLSEPGDYAGGDLELMLGREPTRAARAAGSLHVFPSFVLHRVAPVTHGVRWSLVGWVVGPAFR